MQTDLAKLRLLEPRFSNGRLNMASKLCLQEFLARDGGDRGRQKPISMAFLEG